MTSPHNEEMIFAMQSESFDDSDQLVVDAENFSVRLRADIGDLVAKRNAVLEAARIEAAEVRQEAVEEVESMLTNAQQRFETIVASAEDEAARIIGEAKAEVARLYQVRDRYMSTLHSALEKFRRLPEPS